MTTIFLIFIGIPLVVIILLNYFRKQRNKKRGKQLSKDLGAGTFSMDQFEHDLVYIILTNKELFHNGTAFVKEKAKEIKKLGKFEVLAFQEIREGKFLFITHCIWHDIVATTNLSHHEMEKIDNYNFILFFNEEKERVEVSSTLYSDLDEKIKQKEFATKLFSWLKKQE